MNIKIREEQNDDYPEIYNLIKCAFANLAESDHKEHFLVERLHKSDSFIPQLSLVAENDEHKKSDIYCLQRYKSYLTQMQRHH